MTAVLTGLAVMAACSGPAGYEPRYGPATMPGVTAGEQVITARGIEDSGDPADIGRIGRAVLAGLLRARRARYSARKVKCSTSRYRVRAQDRPELPTRVTRVQITIIAPPPDRPAARPRSRKDQPPGPRQPRPDTRRDQVTRIMASQAWRDWAGRDLAAQLGIKPRNMLTQLAEWTRLGFLAKTGPGQYALPGPPPASAAPAAGQQDPAPAGIIAAAAGRGEAAATHAASLPPPASFPAPAGTPRHRRQAGPARRAGHGRGTGSGPAASRPPSAATATVSTKLRTAKNRDCTPALTPRPQATTLSCLLPAP